MRLDERVYARFLGMAVPNVVELRRGTLDDIPDGIWGVEIFWRYCLCGASSPFQAGSTAETDVNEVEEHRLFPSPGEEGVVGKKSGEYRLRRYIFGSKMVHAESGRKYAITPDGQKELGAHDVFIPAFANIDSHAAVSV